MSDDQPTNDGPELDPEEFLRRMLAICPEDAAEVREDAAKRDRQSDRDDGDTD